MESEKKESLSSEGAASCVEGGIDFLKEPGAGSIWGNVTGAANRNKDGMEWRTTNRVNQMRNGAMGGRGIIFLVNKGESKKGMEPKFG